MTNIGRLKYKQLMRAAKNLFGEDQFALKESRKELKKRFFENKNVTDMAALQKLYADADEALDLLKNNFVQAKRNERGNYHVKLDKGGSLSPVEAPENVITKNKS